MQIVIHILQRVWILTALMAPSLLAGFIVAGVLTLLITERMVYNHMGRSNFAQVCKAAIFGVPLPLCSCSVLPVAASLRQYGAGRGSTISFLTSTPQIGVSSIFVTWRMLGPLFTLIRCVAAFVSGVLCGIGVELFSGEGQNDDEPQDSNQDSCGCPRKSNQEPVKDKVEPGIKIKQAIRYAFVTLPSDMGRSILLGLFLSGVLTAFLPQNYFSNTFIGNEFLSMIVMLIVGLSIYVCSSGSVPIVISLIAGGISPGAGLVFLVTGPATNAAAIVTIIKIVGAKATIVYLFILSLTALAGGFIFNRVVDSDAVASVVHCSHDELSWFSHLCAIILVALLSQAFRKAK